MGAVTRIADVVDALIQVFGEATDLQITDGPHIGELLDGHLVVGLSEGPESPGYRSDLDRLEGSGRRARYREQWTVHCLLVLSTGDTDMTALRSRVGTHLIRIVETLREQPVEQPRPWDTIPTVTGTQWIPMQTSEGAVLNVIFDVSGTCLL